MYPLNPAGAQYFLAGLSLGAARPFVPRRLEVGLLFHVRSFSSPYLLFRLNNLINLVS